MYIIHDVLQPDKFSPLQQRSIQRNGPFFSQFKLFMDAVNEDCILLVVAGGIDSNPDWVEFIKEGGWKVELHGWEHKSHNKMSLEELREELTKGKQKIEETFNQEVTTFFPPRNRRSDNTRVICNELGIKEQTAYKFPRDYMDGSVGDVDFHYWVQSDRWKVEHLRYKNVRKPLFIVGAPRSGTTALLRFMVQKHPEASYLKENEKIWRRGKSIYKFYSEKLEVEGKEFIIDKNARNSLRLPDITRMFPDARYMHIVRDGRAVANSWRNYSIRVDKTDQTIECAAYQWLHYVEFILKHLPKHAETVRYEDMCRKEEYFISMDDKWGRDLNRKEKVVVENIQRPLLDKLGYD